MDNNQHKQEIHRSRIGGFGSSDAKMFYKIGTKGLDSLSQTDIRRIAVAKGLIPYTPIPSTPAIEAGHLFEDWLEQSWFSDKTKYVREPLLTFKYAKNFSTFSHIDFGCIADGMTYEAKYSQKTTDEVLNTYYEQIQWHMTMGAVHVTLIHGRGTVEPFGCDEITESIIGFDSECSQALINGIKILDEAWDNLDLTLRDDITTSDLLPYDAEGVAMMTQHLTEIKRLESEIADYKKRLLLLFEDNNIKSLKSDNYTITYVAPSVRRTFDKKLLKDKYPDINLADFEKESNVASSLKITLK